MRRHALRALVLAGALVALSVPVFHLTSTASACDVYTLNNCTTTSTVSGIGDTVTSPLTFTVSTPAFSETILAGEVPYLVPGSLSIGVSDMRGNNSGFVVLLSANAGVGPGANVTIPASDYTVTSSTATNGFCGISAPGGACETLSAYTPTSDLSSPQVVGCAPYLATGQEGYGMYTLDEGILLSVPLSQQPLNEIFGTNPKEWIHSFNVEVATGPTGAALAPTGCTVQ
jgi:hypothetical protein